MFSFASPSYILYSEDRNAYGNDPSVTLLALQVLLVISVAFYLPLVTMVYQLAGFHVMLLYRGETTYDFIVGEQKRQREKRDREKDKDRGRALRRSSSSSGGSSSSSKSSGSPSGSGKGLGLGSGSLLALETEAAAGTDGSRGLGLGSGSGTLSRSNSNNNGNGMGLVSALNYSMSSRSSGSGASSPNLRDGALLGLCPPVEQKDDEEEQSAALPVDRDETDADVRSGSVPRASPRGLGLGLGLGVGSGQGEEGEEDTGAERSLSFELLHPARALAPGRSLSRKGRDKDAKDKVKDKEDFKDKSDELDDDRTNGHAMIMNSNGSGKGRSGRPEYSILVDSDSSGVKNDGVLLAMQLASSSSRDRDREADTGTGNGHLSLEESSPPSA